MTLGMMLTIVIGGIDLSINGNANLSATIAGIVLLHFMSAHAVTSNWQAGIVLASSLLAAMIVGAACGAFSGFLIGRWGISPILVTLGTMTLYEGVTVGLTKGTALTGFPTQVSVIGNGTLDGIPIAFIAFLIAAVVIGVVLNRTSFGYEVRMLGTNPTAAKFSGIKNFTITWKLYAVSGFFGALAGIVIMGRTSSVSFEYGTQTYVLLTILIAVVSGADRGIGSVIRVLFSLFIFQILSTGSDMLLSGTQGSSFFKQFAWGIVFILFFVVNKVVRLGRNKS